MSAKKITGYHDEQITFSGEYNMITPFIFEGVIKPITTGAQSRIYGMRKPHKTSMWVMPQTGPHLFITGKELDGKLVGELAELNHELVFDQALRIIAVRMYDFPSASYTQTFPMSFHF